MSELTPIIHPEATRLTEENAVLRDELACLLAEAYELTQTVRPNLLALYQTEIGRWELQLLRVRCEAARLRRTVELAQCALNRGMRPDWVEIEGTVELEFLDWQLKIREALKAIEDAEHRMKQLLSPAQSRELKKLYYALVKQLHPDLNPDLDDGQRRLWLRVQEAYDTGDLEELKALNLLAEKNIPSRPTSSLESLRHENEAILGHIASALARIEKIQGLPPFTMRKNLEDQSWVNNQRKEIEKQIGEQKALRDIFLEQLATLRKTHGHGQPFSAN